jgi:uncharacterized repeat protein (TIGR03803 family)
VSKLGVWRTMCLFCIFCAVGAIGASAQTFKSLVSFNGTNGFYPRAGLVQGVDANYYATTEYGGNLTCNAPNGCGMVFKMTPGGNLTALHRFDSTDGFNPDGLVLASNGSFYGTTYRGGANKRGTVFKITSQGKLTTLLSFNYPRASHDGALVQATDGNFYGEGEGTATPGTVNRITAAGKLTRLYKFCSLQNCSDGQDPDGGLVQAADGNFYGITIYGGTSSGCGGGGCGTVFKMTPSGMLTSLYSFCSQPNCTDGMFPIGPLVQATDGSFYGTTQSGGAGCPGCGTVFKITPTGTLTTLYSFCSLTNCADGELPSAGLVQATDGNLYGTTAWGGNCSNCGTVFEITTGGKLTTLYSFCPQPKCTDGAQPFAELVQGTDGILYGTTTVGGDVSCNYGAGCGTVFSLSVGLGPFVETNPTSGKVSRPVTILGNNLTDATGVTFNGTAATFTVVSSTEIKTTVPGGATTGFVEVTTTEGTLKSNVVFRVTQ